MNSSIHLNGLCLTSIPIETNAINSYDQNENIGPLKLSRKVSNEKDNSMYTVVPVVSSSNIPRKKQRQSFSMRTKISWVKDYQSNPEGTNMRSWLDKKNLLENTKVSYTSFRRWNSTLQHMTNNDVMSYSSPYSKKNSVRPHNEMEKVLIEFLKIRNHRLRSSGRRKSTPGYIKAKAIEFYEELYGDDSNHEFKASNGWLSRFQDTYGHLFDPDYLARRHNTKEDKKYPQCQKSNISLCSTDSSSIIEFYPQDSDIDQEYQKPNQSLLQEQKISPGDVPLTEEVSLDSYLDQPLTEKEMEFMRQVISY